MTAPSQHPIPSGWAAPSPFPARRHSCCSAAAGPTAGWAALFPCSPTPPPPSHLLLPGAFRHLPPSPPTPHPRLPFHPASAAAARESLPPSLESLPPPPPPLSPPHLTVPPSQHPIPSHRRRRCCSAVAGPRHPHLPSLPPSPSLPRFLHPTPVPPSLHPLPSHRRRRRWAAAGLDRKLSRRFPLGPLPPTPPTHSPTHPPPSESLPQAPLPIPQPQHQMLGGGWATWCCAGRGMRHGARVQPGCGARPGLEGLVKFSAVNSAGGLHYLLRASVFASCLISEPASLGLLLVARSACVPLCRRSGPSLRPVHPAAGTQHRERLRPAGRGQKVWQGPGARDVCRAGARCTLRTGPAGAGASSSSRPFRLFATAETTPRRIICMYVCMYINI